MEVVSPLAVFDARPTVRGLRAWWHGRTTIDEIVPGLFIGGFPAPSGPIPATLRQLGISHVITTTYARPAPIDGTTSRHVPFLDADVPRLEPIVAAADEAADRIVGGGRVYIHCGHGLDRCAFLAAFVIRQLDPATSGSAVVALLRARRGAEALHNRRFARFVSKLQPLNQFECTNKPGSLASRVSAASDVAPNHLVIATGPPP